METQTDEMTPELNLRDRVRLWILESKGTDVLSQEEFFELQLKYLQKCEEQILIAGYDKGFMEYNDGIALQTILDAARGVGHFEGREISVEAILPPEYISDEIEEALTRVLPIPEGGQTQKGFIVYDWLGTYTWDSKKPRVNKADALSDGIRRDSEMYTDVYPLVGSYRRSEIRIESILEKG